MSDFKFHPGDHVSSHSGASVGVVKAVFPDQDLVEVEVNMQGVSARVRVRAEDLILVEAGKLGVYVPPPAWGEREKLPGDRQGSTHHFAIYTGLPEPGDWLDCYVQVGLYPDGRVGELFVKVGKSGEALAALDQWAMAVSFALQYGADARELLGKFVGQRFEPAGRTRGCEEIKQCSSVVDYVARWVLLRFYPEPASVEGTL